MKHHSFLDTNILIYMNDQSAADKRITAADLCERLRRERRAVVSIQVLQEFYSIATRKLGIGALQAQRQVESWASGPVVRFHEGDVIRAIELHRLAQISFCDALIVHAARLAECKTLYSEDMQPNAVIGGVRIVNPFACA